IHAIAPDAILGFCGPNTTVEYLSCMTGLANWGADIISDDLFFPVAGYNFSVFETTSGTNGFVDFANAHPHMSLVSAGGNDRQYDLRAHYAASTNPTHPDIAASSRSPSYTAGGPQASVSARDRSDNSAMSFGEALAGGRYSAVTVTIGQGVTLSANLTWND